MSYFVAAAQAKANTDFRRVLHTGQRSQLVAMSIPPGEEVPTERHEAVEQTLVFVDGEAVVTVEDLARGRGLPRHRGATREHVSKGDIVVITPGTTHRIENVGKRPLKLLTIYAPPNHLVGTVHETREDADGDVEDEEFGRSVGG